MVDADLSDGVFKQLVAPPGGGKSGGVRTMIVFHLGKYVVFVNGFGKNNLGNTRENGLAYFK